MKTPLAWLNLVHQKLRTLVAVCGVAFAVILIFMQLGFLGAVESTATLLYDRLNFDILMVSREYTDLNHSNTFPLRRLAQAESHADVARAVPVYIGFHLWRNPLDDPAVEDSRRRRMIMILAFRPTDQVFAELPEAEAGSEGLKVPDTVLIDRRSRPEFGPQETGVETELGPRKVQIAGRFTLGSGFGADGMVLTSADTYSRVLGGASLDAVSLGLIQLKPGTDPATVAADLNRDLPGDVRARARAEMGQRERGYWVRSTAVGIIFSLGVGVGLVVGVVFVYQVISSDIEDHLREYATLKAMGYGEGYLARVVIYQAVLLAVAGYLPGIAVAGGLYVLTRWAVAVPVAMTTGRALFVLTLTVAMCAVSGLLALQKVRAADPADLF
jgi:putative ABC transport system permease protein